MPSPRWTLAPVDNSRAENLAAALGISPLAAKVLLVRGIADETAARAFLQPALTDLHSPELLPGVTEAARRIREAVHKKEKILISGDYDVDGITATAILVNFFKLLDVTPEYFIPHRISDGYGLSMDSLAAAAARGVKLVISVDCGVTCFKEAEHAKSLGMDLIITDHHEPQAGLPVALAVVNPKLPGSTYPFRNLSGAATAFKLAWGVAQNFSNSPKVTDPFKNFLLEAMALAGLGTIADVVPLIGENRIFARHGLTALTRSKNPGITALRNVAKLEGKTLDTTKVTFYLGPRLNALGRLSDARAGVELFTTDSTERAEEIAKELDALNRRRQDIEKVMIAAAREEIRTLPALPWGIVIAGEKWHPGVVGIVAAKLADEFFRPVVAIALDGDRGRGSARSIPRVHLLGAITACGNLLERFGGHAQAAGLQIQRENLPAFRERFSDEVRRLLNGCEPEPELAVDAKTTLAELTLDAATALDKFGPFGEGNPRPMLTVEKVSLSGAPRVIGGNGQHLSLMLKDGNAAIRAVGFGMGRLYDSLLAHKGSVSVAFHPNVNEWNGKRTAEMEIKDIRLET